MTTFILAIGGYGPDLINDVANQYVNAINTGFGLIKGDVTRLLNILIILSIMWSAALWALSDDHVIAQFARKIVYIGLMSRTSGRNRGASLGGGWRYNVIGRSAQTRSLRRKSLAAVLRATISSAQSVRYAAAVPQTLA